VSLLQPFLESRQSSAIPSVMNWESASAVFGIKAKHKVGYDALLVSLLQPFLESRQSIPLHTCLRPMSLLQPFLESRQSSRKSAKIVQRQSASAVFGIKAKPEPSQDASAFLSLLQPFLESRQR
jgi:hypothetical protein